MAMPHAISLSNSYDERTLTQNELCEWARVHALIAKTDPAKFVSEVFGPLFFSVHNFFPIVQFWLQEYMGGSDKIQWFVDLFKDICFCHAPSLEIFPAHINLFRNKRLTVPNDKLSQKVTMALTIFMQYRDRFFKKIVPVNSYCCFLFAYHNIHVPVPIVVEAILSVFVKSCLHHNVSRGQTLDGLSILTSRLMAIPEMYDYSNCLYSYAKALSVALRSD
jgi:hypothetical protein